MSIYNMLMGSGGQAATWAAPYVASKRRTMMFIGDSLTWGYGVTQAQAYPALIQARADTQSSPAADTDGWTARNIQADDISITRDSIAFKLSNDTGGGSSITYDNNGPFASSFASTISATGPAILFDGVDDGFYAAPSSAARYLVLMVKATGSSGQTAKIEVFNGSNSTSFGTKTVTVGEVSIGPSGVQRMIFDAGSAISSFLVRRVAPSGGAMCRILSLHITNDYPTSNYIGVQVNARGSYTVSDYTGNVSSIMETVIFPTTDPASPTADPIYVLALGTVAIYTNSPSGAYDRRISSSAFQTDLSTLVSNIRSAAPNSPIVLTNPPIPGDLTTWTTLEARSNYDAAIASVAANYGLYRVDLRNTLSKAAGDYLADDVHPSVGGQIKLADKFIADLKL